MLPFIPVFDPPTPPGGGYLRASLSAVLCAPQCPSPAEAGQGVKVLEFYFASFASTLCALRLKKSLNKC